MSEEMKEKVYTVNIFSNMKTKDLAYQTEIPEGLLPYFRTWNSFHAMQKDVAEQSEQTIEEHPFPAPKNCTGSEEYFKMMLEFADFVKNNPEYPKNRKFSLNPDNNHYEVKDFVPTKWETEFFDRVRKLDTDEDVLRHMLTTEQYNENKPHPQDPVLIMYYCSNYHAFYELLEACAKNTSIAMQNMSIEEMEQMFHEPDATPTETQEEASTT